MVSATYGDPGLPLAAGVADRIATFVLRTTDRRHGLATLGVPPRAGSIGMNGALAKVYLAPGEAWERGKRM